MQQLPTPDSVSALHSQRVVDFIKQEILEHGSIPFSRYMELALYAPGLGYYSAGSRKFGAGGDFVTAPEISPLFSHCVARQCEQVLSAVEQGSILELGAGSGVMALEILRELQRLNQLPVHYYILEVSADLRERQQKLFEERAADLMPRVIWLDSLPEQPFSGVILANEVLDAMPVHKFKVEQGIQEYYVEYQDGAFRWLLKEADGRLQQAVSALSSGWSEPYDSEINLLLAPWIHSLSDSLAQGLILLIDYGFPRHEYYHVDRSMGTLMCHFRHRAHVDPLVLTGIQDLTTHVDFTAVAEAASAAGLLVEGFVHQAAFLLNAGIGSMMLDIDNELERLSVAAQIKQLTMPSEMGELFKCIALCKNFSDPLLGFLSMDQSARL